jgi:RNA-directed DNA polymerase
MDLKDAQEKTTVLQTKLYQAAKGNPKRRFHQLYDKLFREDVLWSAWHQVRNNGGSAGIDGVQIDTIEDTGVAAYLSALGAKLHDQTYRPQPLRRVEIPKSNGKMRQLGIPTVADRIVQAAAKLILEPIFEADFEPTSYGFRPGIGQPDALNAINQNARGGFHFVVDADIEGFFDNLDHERMMELLRQRISDGAVLRLIYRWLKAGVKIGFSWEDTDKGTPQGGVISPLLGNVYLNSLDKTFQDRSKGFYGHLVRYADDLVIQCGRLDAAERALKWLTCVLAEMGLRLSAAKTSIVDDTKEGFNFLGFHHRRVMSLNGPYNMRWPSRRACQKYRDRIKEILKQAGYIHDAGEWHIVCDALNRYIRGWGQYFRHGQGSRVLSKLDWYVNERVARYLARSQPKGKKRKRRTWYYFATWLKEHNSLLRLSYPKQWQTNPYRGQANVRWRAV